MNEPAIVYTIPEALKKAEHAVEHPEVVLSQDQQIAILLALVDGIKSSKCFYNALMQGRRTFVLLEGDPAAGAAMYAWADAAERCGHRKSKVQDARDTAYSFAAAGGVESPKYKQPD